MNIDTMSCKVYADALCIVTLSAHQNEPCGMHTLFRQTETNTATVHNLHGHVED